jgi:hypothetical protein
MSSDESKANRRRKKRRRLLSRIRQAKSETGEALTTQDDQAREVIRMVEAVTKESPFTMSGTNLLSRAFNPINNGNAHMLTAQDSMIDWCKEQQVLLLRLADRLESGAIVIGEKQPDGKLVDNSPETLAQVKSSLMSLDRLLSELDRPRPS